MTIEVFLDAYGKLRKVGVLRRHAGAGRERVTYGVYPNKGTKSTTGTV